MWSIILVHSERPAKSREDSGNKVSEAGQGQAPTALPMAIPCSCLVVPGTNRVEDDDSKHVGTASCQGRSRPPGQGPRVCSGSLWFVQFNQLNPREPRASARRDEGGGRTSTRQRSA